MDKYLVGLILLLAALVLVWRIYRLAKNPGCNGCSDSCAACGQSEIKKIDGDK